MTKIAVAASIVLFSCVLGTPAEAAEFKDFLIMNACTTSGVVDRSKVPGRDSCPTQRNFAVGEAIHYHLRDFGNTSDPNCKARISGREMTNIAVTSNGKTRVLSYKDLGYDPNEDPNCNVSGGPVFRNHQTASVDNDQASIRWVDSATSGMGFIMASGDGHDLSYWITPTCGDFAYDSRKFYDGWPLAKRTLPAVGVFEWLFQKTQRYAAEVTDPFEGLASGYCPDEYPSSFTMWTLDSFTFKSGITLNAVISHHYSAQEKQVANPGDSMALERTYFTDEWGFARWELWHREDKEGTSPEARQITKDKAAQLYQKGRCNTPYDMARSPTPAMTTGTLITSGKYAEKIINGSSGTLPGEYWYMVDCRDYSKVAEDPANFMPALTDLPVTYQAFFD